MGGTAKSTGYEGTLPKRVKIGACKRKPDTTRGATLPRRDAAKKTGGGEGLTRKLKHNRRLPGLAVAEFVFTDRQRNAIRPY